MRNSLFLALVLSLLMVSSAYAAEGKIGVFHSRAVAAKCESFTAAQKKIEGQFTTEKNNLERQSNDLKKRAEALQSQTAALSPEAREDKRAEFLRAKREFEDRYQTYARKLEAAIIGVQREFEGNLVKAAQEYGNRKGYDILLDAGAGGPIFFNKNVDVTSDLIEEINRVYKEGKSAPKR